MEDRLIEILSGLKYPVIRQGSLGENPYPDTFITFWNSTEDGVSFYDNADFLVDHEFMVNVYSNDPSLTYSVLNEARALLKADNWVILTRGYDVASDEITHTGRGLLCAYLKTEQ